MIQNRRRFLLNEDDLSSMKRARFVLLEDEEDVPDEQAAPNASDANADQKESSDESSQPNDTAKDKALSEFKEAAEKLDAIASRFEECRKQLIDSVDQIDDSGAKDAIEARKENEPVAKSVDEKLNQMGQKIRSLSERLGAMTYDEIFWIGKSTSKLVNKLKGKGLDEPGDYTKNKFWLAIQSGIDDLDKSVQLNDEGPEGETVSAGDRSSLDDASAMCSKAESTVSAIEKALGEIENKELRSLKAADAKKEADKKAEGAANASAEKELLGNDAALPTNIAKIVGSDIFKDDVKTFGSDSASNPFISYLVSLKKNHKSVWDKLTLGVYAVVHNGFTSKMIPAQELRDGRDALLGRESLTVNPNWATLYVTDADKYMDWLEQIKDKKSQNVSPTSPDADIKLESGSFKVPAEGSPFSAVASKVLYVSDNDGAALRPIADIEKIWEQLFGQESVVKKTLSTKPEMIIADLAKQIGCTEDELPSKKTEIGDAMRVLTIKTWSNGQLSSKDTALAERLKKIGVDFGQITIDMNDSGDDGKWNEFFDCDNANLKTLLTKYLDALLPKLGLENAKTENATAAEAK